VPLCFKMNNEVSTYKRSGLVARMAQLGVKLGDIEIIPRNRLHLSILLYMLKSSNLAHLRRFSFNFRNFDSYQCTEELEAAKWKLSAMKDGIPYKAIHDGEKMELSACVRFFGDYAQQMIPSENWT